MDCHLKSVSAHELKLVYGVETPSDNVFEKSKLSIREIHHQLKDKSGELRFPSKDRLTVSQQLWHIKKTNNYVVFSIPKESSMEVAASSW